MNYYAHITADQRILGWYTPEVHTDIPTPNVAFTEQEWRLAIEDSANCIVAGVPRRMDLRTIEEKRADERAHRDLLLADLDKVVANPLRWMALSDADKAALQAYRQALLDVPQQAGFPENIEWPTSPVQKG